MAVERDLRGSVLQRVEANRGNLCHQVDLVCESGCRLGLHSMSNTFVTACSHPIVHRWL